MPLTDWLMISWVSVTGRAHLLKHPELRPEGLLVEDQHSGGQPVPESRAVCTVDALLCRDTCRRYHSRALSGLGEPELCQGPCGSGAVDLSDRFQGPLGAAIWAWSSVQN